MLIPSIDFRGGCVVQLVQGERVALETDDLDGWIAAFSRFPVVQVIDLDAALGTGNNLELVRYTCKRLRCHVGGGIRTATDARRALEAGAGRVIVGSALFGRDGVRVDRAAALSAAVGADALLAAVDSRGGRVVIDGWKTTTGVSPEEAMRVLEPHVSGFLATLVDDEGLLGGVNLAAAAALRTFTTRRLAVAGGVSTIDQIHALDGLGIDAVVGMAIYTGAIQLKDLP
jgi:phosphoribosylformimino-5-aminoimidazole carboxamide ribotide isomerase